MIRNVITRVLHKRIRRVHNLPKVIGEKTDTNVEETQTVVFNDTVESNGEKSLLEPCSEDISHISTYLKPTFNFAAYVNKSETLQELIKLGVNLHKIENNVKAVPFILALKFDDIKEHIIFLHQLGLTTEIIGEIITKNPFILKEELQNLEVRVSYLKFKKFTDEMILRILEKNPFWLSHSTQDIDKRLGFFQKHFSLTGNEVRSVATSKPKLITYDVEKVKLNAFVVKEEMGFSPEEVKQIIIKRPSVFTTDQNKLLKTFEYFHKTMNISPETIAETPEILTCRCKRLMQRHLFLEKLGKAQYDPKKPNYVALTTLVSVSDSEFATEVAKSSTQTFNLFMKTL